MKKLFNKWMELDSADQWGASVWLGLATIILYVLISMLLGRDI